MLEKLKNKVLNLNLKKSFAILVIVGVIFGIGSGIVLYQNFGSRISQMAQYDRQQKEEWLQDIEQYSQQAGEQSQMPEWGWHGHNGHYGNWNYQDGDLENWNYQGRSLENWHYGYSDNEWEQMLNISSGDRALIGILSGIGLLLGAVYWLLCMAWAYQKADRMGSNKGLWTIAALFFNLWAIVAMYGYSLVNGTCKNCGRLKKRNEKYCSRCGAAYQQECRNCHASLQKGSKFCPNCGKAMEEDAADSGKK